MDKLALLGQVKRRVALSMRVDAFAGLNARQNIFWLFLFFSFLAASLLAPLASENQIPSPADYINHLTLIMQSKWAFAEGQFPLRVAPLEQGGWRFPLYQFYSPSSYTMAGLVYKWLTPGNPFLAFEIVVCVALSLGGVYMSRLAYWFVQSMPAAILAGVVYLFAPYSIIVVDWFGSLNEALALGLLPVVLYYSFQRYYFPEENKGLLVTGLLWYLLITVHLITFVYASLVIGALFLLASLQNRRHWRNLSSLGLAYALGCLMAMWFLAPIYQFSNLFMVGETYSREGFIHQVHPLFSHLLFSAAALTEGHKISGLLTMHPSLGWPILMAAALCSYAALTQLRSGHRRGDHWLSLLLVLFVVLFIMIWSPLNIWHWLPSTLLIGQYSWRLLAQEMWVGALLFAWALAWLFKDKLGLSHVVIGTLLIAMSASTWFPHHSILPTDPKAIIDKPQRIYNQNDYTLDFRKHSELVTYIDSMLIDPDPFLKINSPYPFNSALLALAYAPTVYIEGVANEEIGKKPLLLSAYLNQKLVATRNIKGGAYEWVIPLPVASELKDKSAPFLLEFKVMRGEDKLSDKTFPISKILLGGFLKPNEIMTVKEVEPHCQQQKISTICQLKISPLVNLVELPVLYYPRMLNIELNGKSVSYQGILYQGKLLTAIKPELGVNTIKINFRGLPWANQLSYLGWGLWSLLLVLCFLPLKNKKRRFCA